MINFEFDDPDQLFGNEAAEHEDSEIFNSYAVQRKEMKSFLDQKKPLQIVSAYKGEGKSALLRLIENRIKKDDSNAVVLRVSATEISPSEDENNIDAWIRSWKKAIFKKVAVEIGKGIKMAFTDDAISLVEEAETEGFRERSFVGAIVSRLASKYVPIEQTKPSITSHERLMQRWGEQGASVWVLIDDVDHNFRNNKYDKTKVATCLMATTQIFMSVPEIKIRLSLRPNVWATIKTEYESLSHVKQYIKGLSWSDKDFQNILSHRIESYLKRTHQWSDVSKTLSVDLESKKVQLLSLVFENPVYWGGDNSKRDIYVPLHTLSRHRPRWMIELCKAAAAEAYETKSTVIALENIIKKLGSFGQNRIEDMVVEFQPQCEKIRQLIVAFAGQNERYSTDQLLNLIRNRVLQGVAPKIVGVLGNPAPREVAHFLFQIGFLSARQDHDDGTYTHYSFVEKSELLVTENNLDQGMSWEIHPVFRQALELKDVESKSQKHRRSKKNDNR